MKPWKVILTVVLLLLTIIRIASTCNKRQKTVLKNTFVEKLNRIEAAKAAIYTYSPSADEIIPVDKEATRLYNRVVDTAIDYYRINYFSEEKRYKQYLKVLYEYKKLAYEYQTLVKLKADDKLPTEKKIDQYREIQQKLQGISMKLDSYRMAAMWDIYE